MKIKMIPLLCAAVLFSGCTSREATPLVGEQTFVPPQEQTGVPTNEQTTDEGTLETSEAPGGTLQADGTTEITMGWLLDEFPTGDGAYFDKVFKGVNPQGSGGFIDYQDYVGTLVDNQLHRPTDSFYLVECISALTPKKASELFSETDNWRQYYEVRLIRDLVDGSEPDRVVFVRMSGAVEYQEIYYPAYAPGEKFTLYIDQETDGFCQVADGQMLRYDVYDEDGEIWAYSRNNNIIDDLAFVGSEDIAETRVTSTTRNPVKYTQKLPLDSLADGMRRVFEENSLTRHYSADGTQD